MAMKVACGNGFPLNIPSEIPTSGGGGGTGDYSDLTNKPQINDVTLSGNKSLADIGAAAAVDVSDIQDLIPSDASSTNKLATADDLPGLATTSAPGLVQPDGTTVTINNGVISAVGGSNPFSNLTPFFYTECLKSGLVIREDNKGYNSNVWSAEPTAAQLNTLNSSNAVLVKAYANVAFFHEIYQTIVFPKQIPIKPWFAYSQSGVDSTEWAQIMNAADDLWRQYGSISTAVYNRMSGSDRALAYEYYILA